MNTVATTAFDAERHLDATAPERDISYLPRFVTKFNVYGPTPAHAPELGPCWTWTAGLDGKGYGSFKLNGKSRIAHRVMFAFAYGPIPPGVLIDHRCHNRACVRICHLRPTDASGNQQHRLGAQRNNVSSGIRGVSFHKHTGAWKAQVGHRGRDRWGGLHSTPEAAEKTVRAMRRRLFEYSDMDRLQVPENVPQAPAVASA